MKRAWLLAGVPLCASSGASLCICPAGCVGLLGVCLFSILFSRVPGQEQCNNLPESLSCKISWDGMGQKGSREPQNTETCQLCSCSSPVPPPSPEADFFPLLLHSSPRCSFMLWCCSGRPSSPGLAGCFLQTWAVVSCEHRLPAVLGASSGAVFFGVGFSLFFNHRIMSSKPDELACAAV